MICWLCSCFQFHFIFFSQAVRYFFSVSFCCVYLWDKNVNAYLEYLLKYGQAISNREKKIYVNIFILLDATLKLSLNQKQFRQFCFLCFAFLTLLLLCFVCFAFYHLNLNHLRLSFTFINGRNLQNMMSARHGVLLCTAFMCSALYT